MFRGLSREVKFVVNWLASSRLQVVGWWKVTVEAAVGDPVEVVVNREIKVNLQLQLNKQEMSC